MTRPTSDRVKESLFNILAPIIHEKSFLDLFAGTGSIGIEALSRGASYATFVYKSAACTVVINRNLINTKLIERAKILTCDVHAYLEGEKTGLIYDIVFMDPPYGKNLVEKTLKYLINNGIIDKNGLVIAEHDVEDKVPSMVGTFTLYRSHRIGDTVISIYMIHDQGGQAEGDIN